MPTRKPAKRPTSKPAKDGIHVTKFKAMAKSLHKDVLAGKPDALRQVAPYFDDLTNFQLTQAQLVIARTQKCESWRKLTAKDDWVHCSFCGKWQYDVRLLIAGPNEIYVCKDCVDLCNDIIEKEMAAG